MSDNDQVARVRLEHFGSGNYSALANCPACAGGGLVKVDRPGEGDTDTCACVTADQADRRHQAPGREVAELIAAVHAFTDTVARIGPQEIGEAAAQLRKAELAHVLERLDDARGSVASVLEELTEPLGEYGIDTVEFADALNGLEFAGEGIYHAIRTIDPDSKRDNPVWL